MFAAIPWSHGTLGFLVAAEVRIIPAKKFVKLEYFPTYSAEELCKVFSDKSLAREDNHFVEGIVFSKTKAVVMCGTMTDVVETDKVRSTVADLILFLLMSHPPL